MMADGVWGYILYSTATIHNLEFSLTIRPIRSMENVLMYTYIHMCK